MYNDLIFTRNAMSIREFRDEILDENALDYPDHTCEQLK